MSSEPYCNYSEYFFYSGENCHVTRIYAMLHILIVQYSRGPITENNAIELLYFFSQYEYINRLTANFILINS